VRLGIHSSCKLSWGSSCLECRGQYHVVKEIIVFQILVGMHEHVMKIQNTLDNAAAVVNTAVVEAKQTFAQAAATDTSVDSLEQAIRNAQQAAQQVVHQAQATGNSATQRINNQEYRRREHVREAAEKMTRTATDSP